MNYLSNKNIQSNINGILVVDTDRRIVGLNRKFLEMWGFDSRILSYKHEKLLFEFASLKLEDPLKFLIKIQEIYKENMELEIHDTIKLKDGQVFERKSFPQYLESKNVARIWMFREIDTRAKLI